MAAPATSLELVDLVRRSGLVEDERLNCFLEHLLDLPAEPKRLAVLLVTHGLVTCFQAEQLLQGKWRGFAIGKYRILERIGSGGMGVVYLCEHTLLGRRVAVKVLPLALARDSWFLEHFYREAQAVAALNHPNIVRAYDIDCSGGLHFLVMEYVDGVSLQEIVDRHGPLSVLRAAHYIRQAAEGLQHAHEVGVVHRDIKPANLLLDRQGTVKILDMGLAHFLRKNASQQADSPKEPKAIVGTGDYLAPEQVVDSDDVDVRADIYGLGATFYFLLTGQPPFHNVSTDYHKLLWHLARSPRPLRELRPEIPEALAALIHRLMAKNPWDRPRTPAALVEELAAWTREPVPPPPAAEMPRLSRAAQKAGSTVRTVPRSGGAPSWSVVQAGGAPSSGRRTDTAVSSTAGADTQRVADPRGTPAGGNSSVTLTPEGAGSDNSSLLRACLTAEAEKPAAGQDTPPSSR